MVADTVALSEYAESQDVDVDCYDDVLSRGPPAITQGDDKPQLSVIEVEEEAT